MTEHDRSLRRSTLTVALITKNEAQRLPECLESIKALADQIVIVDAGSTDDTQQIAEAYGCDFHTHADWPGFGLQRRRAQQYAVGDWVLWLDADERLTAELAQSIEGVLQQPPHRVIYRTARLSWAFDRFIRHSGWYPGYVERMHPRTLTQYNEQLVHESLIIPDGVPVKTLHGDLLHYTYTSLQDYLVKSARYAEAWAQQRAQHGKRSSLLKATVHSVGRFVRTFILKAGFLDGRAGFLLAVLAAQSVFNKHADLALRSRPAPKTSRNHENT